MPKPKAKPKGTLETFRAAHDKTFTARAAIVAALRDLGDHYEYEGDFIALCKIDRAAFARLRDEFAEAHSFVPPRIKGSGNPGKRVWCGTMAFRKKLQASIA